MSFEPTSLLLIAVIIVTFFGVAWGLKTKKGSGINPHPGPDTEDPAKKPEGVTEEERPDSTIFDQRGKV